MHYHAAFGGGKIYERYGPRAAAAAAPAEAAGLGAGASDGLSR